MTIDPAIKKALRTIIIAQCLGMISLNLCNNGFMLAYLSRLGIPGYRILFLLSLLPLVSMLLLLPLAYLADRHGKKRVGTIGAVLSAAGFLLLPVAGFTPSAAGTWAAAGLIIYALGSTINASSWFALLSPIIPKEIRGRFFGQLRMCFQTCAILFALTVAGLLRLTPDIRLFQAVLFISTLLICARVIFYMRIPELEPQPASRCGLFTALSSVLKIPNYLPFCAYLFILALFTGAAPWLFGLLQKEVLGFSDSQLVILGNLVIIGSIAGFYIGGKLVDSFSPKPIFLAGHLFYATILFGYAFRDCMPLPTGLTLGLLSFLFGTVQGAHGIASSSEMLALIPPENKSLSTGLNMTLFSAGVSCSGLLSGQMLKLNMLQPHWTLFGNTLSNYDTLLLGSAVMIILLSVTLGLVPSVMGIRSQWVPHNQ